MISRPLVSPQKWVYGIQHRHPSNSLGGSLASRSFKPYSWYVASLLSYLKISVCFLGEKHHHRSFMPIMGLLHSLVLHLISFLFIEFGYTRPYTPSQGYLHKKSLLRNHVDSLVCRNPISCVLSCRRLSGAHTTQSLNVFSDG